MFLVHKNYADKIKGLSFEAAWTELYELMKDGKAYGLPRNSSKTFFHTMKMIEMYQTGDYEYVYFK